MTKCRFVPGQRLVFLPLDTSLVSGSNDSTTVPTAAATLSLESIERQTKEELVMRIRPKVRSLVSSSASLLSILVWFLTSAVVGATESWNSYL